MAAKFWGEPVREDRSFYVQLQVPREDVSGVLSTLQRGCKRVSDFGYGVLSAPKDCWVEVLHYCGGSSEFLQHLTRLGIPREAVRECREVVSGSGHLMSRQPSLF